MDRFARARLNRDVIFYGLVSSETNSVIEFFPSREAAEAERVTVLADELQWEPLLSVVAFDFSTERAATAYPC